MKVYRGVRQRSGVDVTVDGHPVDPRFDLSNHSPSGFEWGYSGSGPAQLALALLADHFGDDQPALELHQAFKFQVIASLLHDGWVLTTADLHDALCMLQGKEADHP